MGKLEEEAERILALQSYQVLDTPAEVQFDHIVDLAKYICETPIALITFIDEDRQWFKAKVGVEVSETSRDISFCTHTIEEDGLYEVNNVEGDERFTKNPLITGPPFFRFYAGVPLVSSEGYKLGTLCVIDHKPRKLTKEQRAALETLADQTMSQLELLKVNMELKKQKKVIEEQHLRILNAEKTSALSETWAKTAHEINNPLAIIQANTDILNTIEWGEEKMIFKEKLEVIYRNINRIKAIVDEMGKFSPVAPKPEEHAHSKH